MREITAVHTHVGTFDVAGLHRTDPAAKNTIVMIFIGCSIALLAIYAGTKLLMEAKSEPHGKLYRFFAWFIIVMGFFMVLGSGALAAARICCGGHHLIKEECRHEGDRHRKHGKAGHGCYMMERHGHDRIMHYGGKHHGCCYMGEPDSTQAK